jgi:hypothetical protein
MAWLVSDTYPSGKPHIWVNADHTYRVARREGRFVIMLPYGAFLRGKRAKLRIFKTPEAAQAAADKEAARKVEMDAQYERLMGKA